jgi:hypothetical protein
MKLAGGTQVFYRPRTPIPAHSSQVKAAYDPGHLFRFPQAGS